ncbi:hypothetical protein C8034_v001859 [Colletotrichum sidae]|uniref:Uncharacterized protein n=2 Tax=Colletotrichum orbiculare species complex TaxID=2707354 RepID=A0A4R8RQC0_COLTR|nr:hypothetical protein CTRI78_v001291 [Colletotrichum trifolii]TEA16221.1 hypothetical protein C8034_v001859 [Colletotrichum sidae]
MGGQWERVPIAESDHNWTGPHKRFSQPEVKTASLSPGWRASAELKHDWHGAGMMVVAGSPSRRESRLTATMR